MSETKVLDRVWRSARECIDSIAKAFPETDRVGHENILLNSAAQGQVAGRCGSGEIRTAFGDAPNAAWDIPQIQDVSGQEIAPPIWDAIYKSDPANVRIDLTAGSVTGSGIDATDGVLQRISLNLMDIQFDVAALDKHLDISPTASPNAGTMPTLKKTGGRARRENWNDWVAYMVQSVHVGDVDSTMTVSRALQIIAEKMMADGLDDMPDSTVKPAMARTLEMLRARG